MEKRNIQALCLIIGFSFIGLSFANFIINDKFNNFALVCSQVWFATSLIISKK